MSMFTFKDKSVVATGGRGWFKLNLSVLPIWTEVTSSSPDYRLVTIVIIVNRDDIEPVHLCAIHVVPEAVKDQHVSR